jgi:tRNA-Thr(GGU) m(6)t(6)A37 methyltransferase TsaA
MVTPKLALLLLSCLLLGLTAHGAQQKAQVFSIVPVGVVEKKAGKSHLRIFEEYAGALKGLDGYSHVVVLYWFHKNDTPSKRRVLQVHPRGNRKNPLTGVFACRAPVRPNLIALSVCKVLAVEGNTVHIDKIDAFDDTPIIDLKPHIPAIDAPKDAKLPDWLAK